MFKLSVIVAFSLINMSLVSGLYMPRQTNGKQFITGPCQADSDCADGCCGFNTGKCAGAVIAQERDGGCGFGDAAPNNNAAQKIQGPNAEKPQSKAGAAPAATQAAAGAGANNAAAGAGSATTAASAAAGTQFITGACKSDADCASGCCGFNSGKCAGAVIAQERDGGCGFGDTSPNNNAAVKLQGANAEKPQQKAGAAAPAATTAAAAANNAAAGAASTGSGSAAAAGGDFKAANGQKAQQENASFASLTADSACTAGQNACVGDQFAQCVNGKFQTTSCGAGLTCASLPLVNSAGTSITCTTAADRDARIKTALGA